MYGFVHGKVSLFFYFRILLAEFQNLFLIICRVRFHYGHPDVFDRLFHLTRGGVCKASKIINLSEDIFAGMLQFTLLCMVET
jgi:1,3-beta-glucan synthase component